MIKRTLLMCLCLTAVCGTTFAESAAKDAKTEDEFIGEISAGIKQAVEGFGEAAMPSIEKKAKDVWEDIQGEVGKGYLELQSLTNNVNDAVAELGQELRGLVSSNDMAAVQNFLDGIDAKAIAAVIDGLAAAALAELNVPMAKLDEVSSILSEDIKERASLLEKHLESGKDVLKDFGADNEKLFDTTSSKLEGLLSPEDLKQLKAWFDETGKKIRTAKD
jgi:hypothetical protein